MKKKSLAAVLAAALVTTSSCGSNPGSSSTGGNSDSNSGESHAAQEINVCLASEPGTLDPARNTTLDGSSVCAHLFAGLAKWSVDGTGAAQVVPDLAESLPAGVENADGTVTYTYTIRSGAKWSDGKDVTANDFVYGWNRAASPELAASYCYMFDYIVGYDEMWDAGSSADNKLAVTAKDDKTIEVVLENDVAYWDELLAFPSYYPMREDVVENENWATDPSTYICNGPYTMEKWDHNSLITLTKNDAYIDAKDITMDKINFYLSDDANNVLTNFKNGSWQFISNLPTNEMANLKTEYPDELCIRGKLGTYYACWNVNTNLLPASSTLTGNEKAKAEEEIRKAFSLLIDRNFIVDNITQGGQVPASSFVAMGLSDYDNSQFYQNAGTASDYMGYLNVSADAYNDNWNTAVNTLKKYYEYDEGTGKFTDIPSITYLYNTNDSNKAIAENIQGIYSGLGVNMSLENQEFATYIETRKAGNYDVARGGWLADFNDPISFLDMWITNSGNNAIQMGLGDNKNISIYSIDCTDLGVDLNVKNGTWAETYDALITEIKKCKNEKTRYGLMHKAEDLLMETGCITPLYFYTDVYMLSKNVTGFYSNPLGYKYFMNCTIK